jgi:beta-lactamase regulating signal transducer with metallopeptidase domain
MNTVQRLELAIVIISALAFSGLGFLAWTYLPQLMQHVNQVCQVNLTPFLKDPTHRIGLGATFVLILLVVIAASSALASLLKTHRKMKQLKVSVQTAIPVDVGMLARSCGIRAADIKVIKSPDPFVYCHGVSRTRVFISTGMLGRLNRKELEAVIIHEAHHYQHHHPSSLFMGKLLARTLFFLPIIKELSRLMEVQIEINADRAVILAQRTTKYLRQALGKSLLEDALPSAVAFRATPLETRVALIVSPRTAPLPGISKSSLVYSLLSIVMILFPLVSASPASAHPPNGNGICVKDACQVRCNSPEQATETVSFTPAFR